jgi:hypothetical protein
MRGQQIVTIYRGADNRTVFKKKDIDGYATDVKFMLANIGRLDLWERIDKIRIKHRFSGRTYKALCSMIKGNRIRQLEKYITRIEAAKPPTKGRQNRGWRGGHNRRKEPAALALKPIFPED